MLAAGAPELVAKTSDGSQVLGVGKLVLTDNQVDTATGSIRLKGEFANKDHKLWPGLAVATKADASAKSRTPLSCRPRRSSTARMAFSSMSIDDQNRAALRPVVVTHQDLETAVIDKGVNEGDKVGQRRRLRASAGFARDDRHNRELGDLTR